MKVGGGSLFAKPKTSNSTSMESRWRTRHYAKCLPNIVPWNLQPINSRYLQLWVVKLSHTVINNSPQVPKLRSPLWLLTLEIGTVGANSREMGFSFMSRTSWCLEPPSSSVILPLFPKVAPWFWNALPSPQLSLFLFKMFYKYICRHSLCSFPWAEPRFSTLRLSRDEVPRASIQVPSCHSAQTGQLHSVP